MSDIDRRLLIGAAGLAGVAVLSKLAHAGPLTPAAGPVTSTGRTLKDVEPRTPINATTCPGDATNLYIINEQGSYYLTEDMFVPSGKSGILINVNDVTIDLNGFVIQGVPGSATGIARLILDGGSTVHLRNGKVESMGARGVDVYAQSLSIEDISVLDCGGIGIRLQGNAHRVSRCSAFRNGQGGFQLGAMSTVQECVAEFNTGIGFDSNSSGVEMVNCAASLNSAGGFNAFTLNCVSCIASATGDFGFSAASQLTATACSAIACGRGFFTSSAQSRVRLTGCHVASASVFGYEFSSAGTAELSDCSAVSCTNGGFFLPANSMVTDCVVRACTTLGFFTGANSHLSRCSAYGTTLASGFSVGTGSVVRDCHASGNGTGITAADGCSVTGCHVNGNTVRGIQCVGSNCNIDGNTVIASVSGIGSTAGGHIVTRNRLTDNAPNFAMTGTNFMGTSVTSSANVASANAWANFEY